MSQKVFHETTSSGGTFIGIRGEQNDTHPTLDRIFSLLENRNWEIQTDQRILEKYPILANDHWEGKKGDLLFKAHRYPAGFELEFYQEMNTKNRHGGEYDFDKLKMMPKLLYYQFMIELKHIKQLLSSEGYKDNSKRKFKYAFDEVMHRIKDCCHYKQGKELPEYDIPNYNSKDKDGKKLRNGETKYFRKKGRLFRGTIYHNINNMWWVIINKYEFTNVAAFHLFDIDSNNPPKRRIQNKEIPQRVKANKLRDKFKNLDLNYKKINEEHIIMLRIFLTKQFEAFKSEMDLRLSTPRKKDIKVLKRTGLQYAMIEVDGYYFSRREAISFNQNGFIGFAGWASDYNLTPFVIAFEKWMDWLVEVEEVAS